MPYTSYSPNDERFGFSTSGQFKCAYPKDRLILVLCLLLIIAEIVLIVVNFMSFSEIMNPDGSIKGGFISDDGAYMTGSSGSAAYSVINITGSFLIFVLFLTVVGFIIVITVLRSGRKFTFKADETQMTITDSKGGARTFEYAKVSAVMEEERRFPFTAPELDIELRTKDGTFEYRLLHTPMSKVNGISETPFYIIKERIGQAEKPLFTQKRAYKFDDTWR